MPVPPDSKFKFRALLSSKYLYYYSYYRPIIGLDYVRQLKPFFLDTPIKFVEKFLLIYLAVFSREGDPAYEKGFLNWNELIKWYIFALSRNWARKWVAGYYSNCNTVIQGAAACTNTLLFSPFVCPREVNRVPIDSRLLRLYFSVF